MNLKDAYTWPSKSETDPRTTNPLNLVAVITVVSVCQAIYDVGSKPHLHWPGVGVILIDAIFLFCFFRELRAAWLVSVMTYSVIPLLNVSENRDFFISASSTTPAAVRILVLVLWLAWVSYLFYIRKSYFRFLNRRA